MWIVKSNCQVYIYVKFFWNLVLMTDDRAILEILEFFQHKNFCSQRVCRVPEHWPQDRKYPRASASTTLLLLQFHSAGFNFDLLFMCE